MVWPVQLPYSCGEVAASACAGGSTATRKLAASCLMWSLQRRLLSPRVGLVALGLRARSVGFSIYLVNLARPQWRFRPAAWAPLAAERTPWRGIMAMLGGGGIAWRLRQSALGRTLWRDYIIDAPAVGAGGQVSSGASQIRQRWGQPMGGG
jgi:hypothetical protein